jgi:sulfur carrier protein
MQLTINGAPHVSDGVLTLSAAVASLTTARTGVAAAVNGEVVRRAEWDNTMLTDGDDVEVLTAVQGG